MDRNDEEQLFGMIRAYASQRFWLRAADNARAAGLPDENVTAALEAASEQPDLSPLDVLAATVALDDLLTIRKRHLVADARAAGATWAQIATTLGVTPQSAWTAYHK